jgi:hypothetical protein
MRIERVEIDQIERMWPVLADALWPAIRQDPTFDMNGLYSRLVNGSALLFVGVEQVRGLLVVSVAEDGNDLVAWTTALAAKFEGGPKARLSLMREGIRQIEDAARVAGCVANRICGRDYSKLFPGYVAYEGARNGLEKRL